MKKLIPILLTLLLCTACINDDLSMCAGKMYCYFKFWYGGSNRFYEQQKADMVLHFYHEAEPLKYREMDVRRSSIGPQQPLTIEKRPEDTGSLLIVSWSKDEALTYVTSDDTPRGEGYVQLKEMTEGSGICRPVKDLFYGDTLINVGERLDRANVTIPHVRPICLIRLTMDPQNADTRAAQPGADAYTFLIHGTLNRLSDDNIPGGENTILSPIGSLNRQSGKIETEWFGAFPSPQGQYLRIEIYLRDRRIANFDCSDMELASIAGQTIDLEVNAKYIRPQMEVKVNGWYKATVLADM